MTDLTQSHVAPTGLSARISAAWTGLGERLAKYRLYRQSVEELAQLTDRDLADIGLTRAALRASVREAIYGN